MKDTLHSTGKKRQEHYNWKPQCKQGNQTRKTRKPKNDELWRKIEKSPRKKWKKILKVLPKIEERELYSSLLHICVSSQLSNN